MCLAFRWGLTILFKPKKIVLSNFVKWQKARCDAIPVPLQLEYRSYVHTCYRIVGDSPGLRLPTEVLNVDVAVVQVIDRNDDM